MTVTPMSQPVAVLSLIQKHVDGPLRQLVGKPDWNQCATTTTMEQVRKMKGDTLPYWLQGAAQSVKQHIATSAPQSAISFAGAANGIAVGTSLMHMGPGLGTAAAPWITALLIFRDYRGIVNKNDLHDVAPLKSHKQSPFQCSCQLAEDGSTQCDSAIRWLIDRSEMDLCVKAVSFMLGGLPSLSQFAYRKIRSRANKNSIAADDGQAYITPGPSAVWMADAANCSACNVSVSSQMLPGADRHHCRVCGECFCGECCSIRTAVRNPLRKGGIDAGVKANQLVCNLCVIEAKERGSQTYRYEDGPHRRTATLKKNALAKSSMQGGCPRALAALYAICNGCTTSMFWALVARDGNDDLVRRLKM